MGQLVITGCNSMVIFKLVKEIFTQMTFTINVIITIPFMLDIFSGWYGIRSLLSSNVSPNFFSLVGFIGDDIWLENIERAQESTSYLAIMNLTTS